MCFSICRSITGVDNGNNKPKKHLKSASKANITIQKGDAGCLISGEDKTDEDHDEHTNVEVSPEPRDDAELIQKSREEFPTLKGEDWKEFDAGAARSEESSIDIDHLFEKSMSLDSTTSDG